MRRDSVPPEKQSGKQSESGLPLLFSCPGLTGTITDIYRKGFDKFSLSNPFYLQCSYLAGRDIKIQTGHLVLLDLLHYEFDTGLSFTSVVAS